MHRLLILIVVLTCGALSVMAQKGKGDETVDARGDMYYAANGYTRALDEYYKAYAKKNSNPLLLRRITECIMELDIARDTAIFFIDAYLQQVSDDAEAVYMSAQAYFHAHQFDKAKQRLDKYKEMVGEKGITLRERKFERFIEDAKRMVKNPMKNRMVNLGDMINTPYSELTPYIMNDNTLVFSSDEKFSTAAMLNIFNIKYSEYEGLSWSKSRAIAGQVNTTYDEYVCGVHGNHMFFNSNRTTTFSIWECDAKGSGRFTDGVKLESPIDGEGDEVAATLSFNGDTIIYSATTKDGDLDIYYSIKVKGEWGPARLLPGAINKQESDENYPQLTPDGKRLYFCSDREGSMGGYDLFYSDLDEKTGEWGEPVQMPYPINDTYDNTTISFTSNGRYGYISSIRKDGFGSRDIYAVIFDNVPAAIGILKCFVGIDAKPKAQPLGEQPLIRVMNSKGELAATANLNLRSSTFILALEPDTYTISIDANGAEHYEEKLVIEERLYEDNALERIILLKPKL